MIRIRACDGLNRFCWRNYQSTTGYFGFQSKKQQEATIGMC